MRKKISLYLLTNGSYNNISMFRSNVEIKKGYQFSFPFVIAIGFEPMTVCLEGMAFLKKKYVFDGRVKYRRTKTSRIYNIKLTEMLLAIFDYYARDKGPEDFIFPIIKRKSLADQYKDIKWARKLYNARLKNIAEKCGIEENLTSYVSRHSFAMSARLANTPIEVISQMLGHKDTKTTQIYLDSIPDKTVDDYADKVSGFTNEAMLPNK